MGWGLKSAARLLGCCLRTLWLLTATAGALATAERVAAGLDAPLMPWRLDCSCMLCMTCG
jgi:hypothetical protein